MPETSLPMGRTCGRLVGRRRQSLRQVPATQKAEDPVDRLQCAGYHVIGNGSVRAQTVANVAHLVQRLPWNVGGGAEPCDGVGCRTLRALAQRCIQAHVGRHEAQELVPTLHEDGTRISGPGRWAAKTRGPRAGCAGAWSTAGPSCLPHASTRWITTAAPGGARASRAPRTPRGPRPGRTTGAPGAGRFRGVARTAGVPGARRAEGAG